MVVEEKNYYRRRCFTHAYNKYEKSNGVYTVKRTFSKLRINISAHLTNADKEAIGYTAKGGV